MTVLRGAEMSVGDATTLSVSFLPGSPIARRCAMPENIAYAEPSAPSGEPAGDEPTRRECLRCYLVRMIRVHGCDNTRTWTLRWRARRAPRDGQLMEQLEERGGI